MIFFAIFEDGITPSCDDIQVAASEANVYG
jgi:hypothetical protein